MEGWIVKKSTLESQAGLLVDNFSIVGREDHSIAKTIKEAILIRVNDPSLNRNIGKFQLPHIWHEVLVKSPELKLK